MKQSAKTLIFWVVLLMLLCLAFVAASPDPVLVNKFIEPFNPVTFNPANSLYHNN